MTKCVPIVVFWLSYFLSFGQDYPKLAAELQQKFKEDQALLLQSTIGYEFAMDAKASAKVTETKNRKLLSLRYNETLLQLEFYDNHSLLEKFYGESSLKQRATDPTKFCATYTRDGLFYDDSKFCSHSIKLKEVGEVWNLSSTRKINDPKYLTTVYFQEKFPLIEKKLTFSIPQEIEVELKEFHFEGYAITKTERKENNRTIIEYTARDLVKMPNEDFQGGAQHYLPHVLVLTKSMMRNGKRESILSSTQDLYTWYSSLTQQLKPDHKPFATSVGELIADKKTDIEKVKAIYYWVQDNIRYIAFEDGLAAFKPDEAQNVFEKRYGDCKGMANLTKEMLKAAGFDARLTWIGTKRIMYDQTVPSLAVNNHMICTIILQGKKYFLDATEKYVPFEENAERIQNRTVMIEDGDNFIIDKIGSEKDRDMDVRSISVKINGEDLVGMCKVNLKGEARKNFLYSYHFTKREKQEEYIKNFLSYGHASVKTEKLTTSDLNERSRPLSLDSEITLTGAVSAFKNELYIDIDPAKSFRNLEVKEERQSDLDFGQKIHHKTTIELQMPEGYKVGNLPTGFTVSHPDFSFAITYKVSGKKIIYTKEMKIPNGVVRKSDFQKWNSGIKELANAYDNQILLKK